VSEYMLRILNRGDHQAAWTSDRHREFVKKCETYIMELQQMGQLRAAQPLVKRGAIVARAGTAWSVDPLNTADEIQVGYYHIVADTLDQAVEIAKKNPEFEYSTTARVEIRPLKEVEEDTGFAYPR
jgi:hypothetical protein